MVSVAIPFELPNYGMIQSDEELILANLFYEKKFESKNLFN